MVAICQMTLGVSLWVWLCPDHRATRERNGWSVKVEREAAELRCDDCPIPRGPKKVAYVPTSRSARLPTEAEYPREKPVDRKWGEQP